MADTPPENWTRYNLLAEYSNNSPMTGLTALFQFLDDLERNYDVGTTFEGGSREEKEKLYAQYQLTTEQIAALEAYNSDSQQLTDQMNLEITRMKNNVGWC